MKRPHGQDAYLEQVWPKPEQRWLLADSTFSIGRDHHCNAVVKGEHISREHAKIFRANSSDASSWVLQDLSLNGIYAADGGERFNKSAILPLKAGQEFDLGEPGEVRIRFCCASAPAVDATPAAPERACGRAGGAAACAASPRTGVGASHTHPSGTLAAEPAPPSSKPRLALGTEARIRGGDAGPGAAALACGAAARSAPSRSSDAIGEGALQPVASSPERGLLTAGRGHTAVADLVAGVSSEAGAVPGCDDLAPPQGAWCAAGWGDDDAEELSQEDAFLLACLSADHGTSPGGFGKASGEEVQGSVPHGEVGGGGVVTERDATPPPALPPHVAASPPLFSHDRIRQSPRPCSVLQDTNGRRREPTAAGGLPAECSRGHARLSPPAAASLPPSTTPAPPPVPPPRLVGFVNKPSLDSELHAEAEAEAAWIGGKGILCQRYGAPPFTVLDARKGYWQDRRRWWHDRYGINSELGRGDNLLGYGGLGGEASRGTSVFCPVLTELCYKWWCPAGGAVLDPFAGGSVRGIVAGRLGLRYVGMELSATQVAENQQQAIGAEGIATDGGCRWRRPEWVHADARRLSEPELDGAPLQADFLFSCPPYYNLERYSNDPRDLSNASAFEEFLVAYRAIIAAAVARLAPRRFACFVVGEIRSADGFMRNFVGETVNAFEAAGCRLYNSAVMLFPLNTLPMRVAKQFNHSLKLGMSHQQVLVFYNGKHPDKEVPELSKTLTNVARPLNWR